MARMHAFIEILRFLIEGHEAHFDMCNAGPGARPNAARGIGHKVENVIVGKIAPTREVLPAIERLGRIISADQPSTCTNPFGTVHTGGHTIDLA